MMNSCEPAASVVPVADDEPPNEPEPVVRVAFRGTPAIVLPKRSLATTTIDPPETVAAIVRTSDVPVCAQYEFAESVWPPEVAVTTQFPAVHAYKYAVAIPVAAVNVVAVVDVIAQPVPVTVHVTGIPAMMLPFASLTIAVTAT